MGAGAARCEQVQRGGNRKSEVVQGGGSGAARSKKKVTFRPTLIRGGVFIASGNFDYFCAPINKLFGFCSIVSTNFWDIFVLFRWGVFKASGSQILRFGLN